MIQHPTTHCRRPSGGSISPRPRKRQRPAARRLTGLALPLCAALLLIALLPGCGGRTRYDNSIGSDVGATFTGERYLRGSIGSYGSFINNRPLYVGGYGMVVDLNATGSNEVPGFLREWLINEMRRNRLGSVQFGTERFTPERVIADLGSTVVAVEGLIPPGAKQGSKFDLLVSMIDQTSTSLAGGRLFWPTQLSPTGLDRRLIYTDTRATGYGEVFVNPVAEPGQENPEFLRRAVVVGGGTVMESRRVEFVLNVERPAIAASIAERINARFPAGPEDRLPTANARNGTLIEINVPQRFAGQPDELLALIEHIFLNDQPDFVQPQAQALGEALAQSPADRARPVALAWKMLGPNALPVIRDYYNHQETDVRAAALEAGAWLQDAQSVGPLTRIATAGNPGQRIWAARALVAMTRVASARKVVLDMLNDPDPEVRLGAYEALVMVRDRSIDRLSVDDGLSHKFFIDRVPSKYPMVYAIQGQEQAVVIFGGDLSLGPAVFAKIDDHLSMRTIPVNSIPIGLTAREPNESAFIPIHRCGSLELIPSATPVSKDPGATLPPPDWRIQVGDNNGNRMFINVRGEAMQDAVGVNLLNVPGRDTPTEKPRAVAMVRVVKPAGKDKDGNPTPAVGELIRLHQPDDALPVAIRYRKPGDRDAKVYRITPTLATLTYTLGYKEDNINTKLGPDLSFSRVVQVLHEMSRQGALPAPFTARISPLAQRIAAAQQENQAEPRPDITPEELEILREQGGTPGQPGNQPGTPTPAQPAPQPTEPATPTPASDTPLTGGANN